MRTNVLSILPSESFVTQAFDELITDTQNLFAAAMQSTPIDKDEAAFWRRQRNAFVNAQADWIESGFRPTPTESGYLFPSSSRPGSLRHRVWQLGGVWVCSCESGERGLFHRHTATIAVLERAAELETLAEDAAELRITRAMTKARRELLEAA
jgi:hypothetical protein